MWLNEGTIAITQPYSIMSLLSRCFLVECVVDYYFPDARRMGLPARERMDDHTHDLPHWGRPQEMGAPTITVTFNAASPRHA